MRIDVVILCVQMKSVVCRRLASLLRMKVPLKMSAPSPVTSRKNSLDAGDSQLQPVELKLGTTDKLLMEIRDLLRTKLQTGSEGDCEKEEEEEKRNDWKLAAAVFDRLLFIIFSILFVGGTVIFSITFAFVFHPHQ